eukprot:PITA_27015
MIENQSEKKIKILRTDNGTEYKSNEFHDYCREAGIKRKITTPYTPEQNGVAERKNRTIVEVVRTMLHDQGLLKFLWAGAANTDVEVEISHDFTFDDDMDLNKINNLPIPRKNKEDDTGKQGEKEDETMLDVDEPMDPIDPHPQDPSSSKRRPSWLRETLEDVERHIAPRGNFHESEKPNRYQGCLIVMSIIIQSEPSSFEEDVKQKVWKDSMNEEYKSIMKNDV